MLPVPMDAARAVHMALKGETAPAFFSVFFRALPSVFFMMWMKCVNCGKPLRIPTYKPTPMINIMAGAPQMKLLIARSMPFSPSISSYSLSML